MVEIELNIYDCSISDTYLGSISIKKSLHPSNNVVFYLRFFSISKNYIKNYIKSVLYPITDVTIILQEYSLYILSKPRNYRA